MKGNLKYIILLCSILLFPFIGFAQEESGEKESFNPKDIIFEHLGDEYGWKIIGTVEIPLPVIVRDNDGGWHLFSSSRLAEGQIYDDFRIAADGDYAGKVVGTDGTGQVYRPWDLSVTKNVLSLIIAALVMFLTIFPLVRWYRRNPLKAPVKGLGIMEFVINMLYTEVILSVLGKEAKRYGPYLLTLFFFILFANLLGMIVIFPGGANIMGNIAVTMVLAILTFIVVNVSGTRHYWRDVFWPDVPMWLKCPVPLMPLIEIFGVITKPVALMIRLFANMLGGHLITLVLICLIFIFGAMGAVATGATTVVAVVFAVFMNLIDFLICFIQAYVFMMLSTIFISLARAGKYDAEI